MTHQEHSHCYDLPLQSLRLAQVTTEEELVAAIELAQKESDKYALLLSIKSSPDVFASLKKLVAIWSLWTLAYALFATSAGLHS